MLHAVGAACVTLAALGWLGPSLIGALTSPWMSQAWGVLCAVVLLLALVRAWRAALAFSLPLIALSLWVLPVLLPIETAAPARTLRFAYANVNAWNGPTPDAVQWFESTGADVVALIECSQEWIDALRAVTRAGSSLWPHAAVRIDDHPIGGVAVLSRHPLRDVEAIISPVGRFPMIDAVVEAPDGPVRVMAAHPVPPVGVEALQMRDAEIRWLAQRAAGSALPTAIVADFNDTPFGRALRDFAASSGMRSAASATGLVTTWPARVAGMPWPSPLRITIDHCFVSGEIGIASLSAGPRIGSDHLPLVIDIAHRARETRVQSPPAGDLGHGTATGQEGSADQSPKLR